MSLGISRSNLLRNLSTHKGTIKASEGMIRAAGERNQGSSGFLMPPHPSTNFYILKYYEKDLRFDGIYSSDNSSKIKDGAYVTNLELERIGQTYI